ncbi:hypothetical protein SUGI_0427870 [Cryptomeria japonica]|nr:hypothetical protein SUGI_0427870 [Cryptomeria japonica]
MGRLILVNPRLMSYSIEKKLQPVVEFFLSLGLSKDGGDLGKVLVRSPHIMGYSVEGRLKPTVEFLRKLGLNKEELRGIAVHFPEMLCRDVEKALKPNVEFLRRSGFGDGQICRIISGFPPVLTKSVKTSLQPKVSFLVDIMRRSIDEVVEYPDFFRHGLKKRIEYRYKQLKQKNVQCSLVDMLSCSHKKFFIKFGIQERNKF